MIRFKNLPKLAFSKDRINYDEFEEIRDEVLDIEFYDEMFSRSTYYENLKEIVEIFLNIDPAPPLDFRNKAVKVLCEAYVQQTGEVPHGIQLILLGNWILVDDLTNSHPDKVTRTEYPIINKRQLSIRHRRELSDEMIEYKAFPPLARKKFTSERPSK